MADNLAPRSGVSTTKAKVTWVLLLVALFTLMSVGSVLLLRKQLGGGKALSLPDYGEAPDFQLTERSGKSLTKADLAGVVWVADFIFTRCPGLCPLLSTRMAMLQQQLHETTPGRPVRLVSFSVDPEWDTPERLREYATRYQARPDQWLFLTGSLPTMTELVTKGFRLSLAPLPPEQQTSDQEPIVHSDRLVLVDANGKIRGYYHGSDEEDFAKLLPDIGVLRRE
jgi:cytochrome oxidase Cu insertion factor (SCO1/SenC/PrrC family)